MATAERLTFVLSCTECKNKNYYFAKGKKKDYKVWYDNVMVDEGFQEEIERELNANLLGVINGWGINEELIGNLIDDNAVRNVADAKAQAIELIDEISARIDNTKNIAVNQIFGV